MIRRYTGSSFYNNPWTAYSSSLAEDVSSHGYEPMYGYHDPTLHSAIPSYAFDHDHHPLHFDHHVPDYGHYVPGHTNVHGMVSDDGEAKESDMGGGEAAASTAMSPTYRRVGRHRRRRANKRQPFE